MALPEGFQKKNFLQVKAEIEESLTDSLGEVNLVAPSIFANIVSVFAERESQLWDMLSAVYSSAYPDTAEGYSLDAVCALNGITRLPATYSNALAQITAINYTKINKDTKVAVKGSGSVFLLEKDIVVTNDKCYWIKIEILSTNSAEYTVSINGQDVTYNRAQGHTKEQIAEKISDLINRDLSTIVISTFDGNKFDIKTNSIDSSFSCYISNNDMRILEVSNNANFIAEEKGAIPIPAFSLADIKTPVSGFLSVTNATSGITGTNIESDANLRTRRNNSLRLSGSGTLEAIKAAIMNIEGVISASIYENNTDVTDAKGLPPHSFKILVTGGDDKMIADSIWQKKPAGIQSFGNITVVVKDSNNKEHNISFSRSIKRYISAKITITKTAEFINESAEVIKTSMVEKINKLGSGKNVILKSLYCSVFDQSGVTAADILIGSSLNETQTPTLAGNDIIMGDEEVASADVSRIEIILQDA
jgi:uncharacterized phage protein gp47/JayE